MRVLIFCFVAIVSVIAFSGGDDISFEPDVPRVYLQNMIGANVSFLNIFKEAPEGLDSAVLALYYADQLIYPATYFIKSSYETKHNGIRHVYLKQKANDLEILNGDLNINIFEKKVLSVGHSFYYGPVPVAEPEISSVEGLHSLGNHLGDHFNLLELRIKENPKEHCKQYKHTLTGYPSAISDVKAELAYVQVEYGKRVELVWAYEVDVYDHWWNAYVSATSGQVLALYDWVDQASYNVYPVGVNDPDDGERVIDNDPHERAPNASPNGWVTEDVTIGNNCWAQENWAGGTQWQNNYRPGGGDTNDFDFPINWNQQPDAYIDAAITNLFYWNNVIHDLFYLYGFDEVSGNFQDNNFGRGGLGNDAVQANAQDGSGTNNANFATPIDGQRPRMRMYIWTRTNPNRDGDLDAGIVVHEYGHGISIRLTGGPQNVNCLNGGEAGGMGEGWGDWWATALRQRSSYHRNQPFEMGEYDNVEGIRNYPYTTNMAENPETYNYITRAGYAGVHAKGAVWCGILWEAYWNFVDEYGFDPNWYESNKQNHKGNHMILQDVVDGLKLQPCNPSFVDARDAILAADRANYGGRNLCFLWRAFAKRGLGTGAARGGTESFIVPSECN